MPLEVYVYKLLLKCRAASQESGKVVLEAASITWQMGIYERNGKSEGHCQLQAFVDSNCNEAFSTRP